ncbi:MAG: hypothetical protein ACI9BH_002899, partial [Paracoccaceae bacterium]
MGENPRSNGVLRNLAIAAFPERFTQLGFQHL